MSTRLRSIGPTIFNPKNIDDTLFEVSERRIVREERQKLVYNGQQSASLEKK